MRVAITVSIGLAAGLLALPADARQAPPARQATNAGRTVLADLRQETGEASTRLVIAGSAKPSFTYHSPDPLTLVVDIADADSTRLPARLEVATREIESLRVYSLVRGDGRPTARVEVRLAALSPFTVEEAGNDVLITVSRPANSRAAALPAPQKAAEPQAAAPVTPVLKAPVAPARSESAPRATRISGVTKLPEGQLGYHVAGNGTLKPETFFLKNPNRLVVDFPDVITTKGQSLPAAVSPVKGIRLAQFSAAPPRVARLVLDVEGATPYRLVPDANGVAIVFGEGAPAAPAPLGAPAKAIEPEVTAVVQKEPVALEAPEPQSAPPTSAASMAPTMSMKPMLSAEPIALQPIGSTGGADINSGPQCGEPPFSGHLISMDFKEGDLIDMFRLMSEVSSLNIIVNPGISGKVSLTVKEVPWDQALSLVLKTQGLGCVIDGNVVRIARLADLKKEETDLRDLKKERELSGEQTSWQGRLSYLDTDQVKSVVEKTVLSDRGTFTAIGTSPVFIIRDLPERVDAAKRLVMELDRPSAQVEIEARIVITSRNFSRQMGVQWGFLNQQVPQYGNTTNLAFPNSVILNGQAVGNAVGGLPADQGGLAPNAGIGNSNRGYMINLPTANATSGIGVSLGNILGSFNLDAALTAAEATGRARIISTPRITTQNKVEAEIKQGVQIPYQTISNGTVTVNFKDAGLSLKVTPQITDAGTVFMKILVDNSTPDFGRELPGGVPINTQSAQTSVLVKDGATTVIGGIYQGQETSSRQNTPFLSQIPVLGLLFKNKTQQSLNNELLIFITPRIVR